MNNIAFKSKIQFVDKKTFIDTANGKRISPDNRPGAFGDEFYTITVRTCTGGGIVVPNKEAYGFHFFDSLLTNKTLAKRLNLDVLLFDNPPERAVIIGSKDHHSRPYSKMNFKTIERVLEKHIDNISIFEEHVDNFTQSNLHYNLKTDTYTILTQFVKNGKEECIKTLEDLLANFKRIKIAHGDELFIGKEKILKEMCPKIFKI